MVPAKGVSLRAGTQVYVGTHALLCHINHLKQIYKMSNFHPHTCPNDGCC